MQLTYTGSYHAKDQAKSSMATQFIGLGSKGSSTDVYRQDWGSKANTGTYTANDVIFISINGARHNRVGFKAIQPLVDKAIAAGATLITDTLHHRSRPYNIGEREVAAYLVACGYVEQDSTGVWVKSSTTQVATAQTEVNPMKQFNPMQYLAIDIANHFGLDKLPYEERIQWVKSNIDSLESFQSQAEEPILYAKAVNALRLSQNNIPTGHTVAFDSVCSGLQLMSVMTNCKSGMTMTGLIDPDTRPDAYTTITEHMNKLIKDDGLEGVVVSRSDSKTAIMTLKQ